MVENVSTSVNLEEKGLVNIFIFSICNCLCIVFISSSSCHAEGSDLFTGIIVLFNIFKMSLSKSH